MKEKDQKPEHFTDLRERLHEIIFEAETPAGKWFDVVLLAAIVLNIAVIMFESIPGQTAEWTVFYYRVEWFFTIFFTLEYILRLYSVYKPLKFAGSFFGVIDLLSILPSYLSMVFPGLHSLMVIRSLRLLRLFRIFKLHQFTMQSRILQKSIESSLPKILIFSFFVLILVFIFGSVMFVVENEVNPKFDSIPRSIYWAIITVTTVGYGDISPITTLGQFVASFTMLIGYAVLAVPTGIITTAMIKNAREGANTFSCRSCGAEGHDTDAKYCKYCGADLS